MVFRDTGLSPSLARLSRRVLLNNKHNSQRAYRLSITPTCNAILATTVIFKSPPCGFENTKMVWANKEKVTGHELQVTGITTRHYSLVTRY